MRVNVVHHRIAALVDTLLLLYYLVDYGVVGTFIRSVSLPEPLWYRVTFPYLLHPFKWFSISSSIFMVVAISAERHRAICSPLTHRPAFWPYAVMVFCVAGEWSNVVKGCVSMVLIHATFDHVYLNIRGFFCTNFGISRCVPSSVKQREP